MTESGLVSRGAPTLEAVAERAGVSRATASRVLRGEANVSARARDAVLAAASALAYAPNRAARSLVTGRTDSLAFYVEETEDRMFADPFFLGMLRGAQAVTAGAGLQLVFSMAATSDDRRRFVNYAAGGHVDGVMLLSLHGRDDVPQKLEAHGIPIMLSGRPLDRSSSLHYVDADNVLGGTIATSYLVDSGRRCIGTVTGPLDMCAGQDRLAGYRAALREHGRPFRRTLVAEAMFTTQTGFDAMRRLLERVPDIDAVFAASDLTAIGAMRAIEASGRTVFDDVAVVGFDDIAEASATAPALTTVRQPIAELGRTMAERLIERVRGHATPTATVLPVELVKRSSA